MRVLYTHEAGFSLVSRLASLLSLQTKTTGVNVALHHADTKRRWIKLNPAETESWPFNNKSSSILLWSAGCPGQGNTPCNWKLFQSKLSFSRKPLTTSALPSITPFWLPAHTSASAESFSTATSPRSIKSSELRFFLVFFLPKTVFFFFSFHHISFSAGETLIHSFITSSTDYHKKHSLRRIIQSPT